jgi:hypothetical protein
MMQQFILLWGLIYQSIISSQKIAIPLPKEREKGKWREEKRGNT